VPTACQVTTLALSAEFVDSIPPVTGTASTLLDLTDSTWCVVEGTRFDPPDIKRVEVSSMLRDGESYPESRYENRVLQLRLAVQAASADALATQLQLLSKQLDKPANILRVAEKTSTPVYFRTYRVSPRDIDIITQDKRSALVNVDIPADPFGYGPQQVLPAVTVNNDPAAGSNGMYWDVSGILGDVETPVTINFGYSTPFGAGTLSSAIGIRRGGTVANLPMVLQAESMSSAIADTTLQANDAVMSGAGSNYMRTTFATATAMTVRLTYALHPAVSSLDARGLYRVFLRHRQGTGADVIQVRLSYGQSDGVGQNYFNDTITLASNTNRRWTDLGLLPIPAGGDPVYDGISGNKVIARGVSVALAARRVSGSGNFDWDCLLFVPADDRYGTVKWPNEANIDNVAVDAITDSAYALENTTEIRSTASPFRRTAGLPYLSPDITNRIVLVLNADPNDSANPNQNDVKTHTASVTLRYWPRYLAPIKPVAT
jgi:hypothetical protein